MPLPAAARKNLEAATKLIEERNANRKSGATQLPPNTDPSAGAAEKLQTQIAEKEKELGRAQQSFRVLQGKYNAEVPALQNEVRELKAKLKDAEAKIARAGIKAGDVASLSAEERENMGSLMHPATKIATEIAEQAVAKAVKPLEEELQKRKAESDSIYIGTLDNQMPNWREVNDDPKLKPWLATIDPETQQPRGELLRAADNGLRAYRVVEIFRAFLEGREIGARKDDTAKAEETKEPKKPRVDPPSGGAGANLDLLSEDGKKVYTKGWIANFYRNRLSAPEYQGEAGKKLAREIELDIAQARQEGRVRSG